MGQIQRQSIELGSLLQAALLVDEGQKEPTSAAILQHARDRGATHV
jgi:hypothetical protein